MDYLYFVRSRISSIGHRKFMIVVIAVSALLLSGPLFIRRLSLSVDERAFLFRGQMTLFIEAVIFAASWYVWVRLRHLLDSISGEDCVGSVPYCTWFIKLVVAVVLFLAQMSFVINYLTYGEDPSLLSFICFVCLGILVQFVICYFCLSRALQVIDWAVGSFSVGRRPSYTVSVHGMKFIIASLFSVSISIYGLYQGLQAPVIKTLEVPIKGLAASMDWLNVVAISDIHLGPTVGRTKLERVVHMVNNLKPGLYDSLFICTLAILIL